MFRSIIRSSPLVDDTANEFFKNIKGRSYNEDISFLSTLRALVAPRMTEDDSLFLHFGSTAYSARDVASHPASNVIRAMCTDYDMRERGVIYVHSCRGAQDGAYACLELLKSGFCKEFTEWQRLEKVTDFYRKQFFVMCFINPTLKSVIIFVDNLDMRKMHYLQCSIFAFLPWYFDPAQGVSELEMELINSLREKTPEKYHEVIAKIASQYDFRACKIRKLLKGFESKSDRIERDELKNRIADILNNVDYLNRQISDNLKSKNDLDVKLLGLEARLSGCNEESEIMDYFLCNQKLVLLNVSDSIMRFGVKTYIEYFDEDMASSMISNMHSYIYYPDGSDGSAIIPKESMNKLMKAIFVDQILKVRVCAAYEFNLSGNVHPLQDFGFGYEFNDCVPNPHIDGFRCLGNYTRTINELLLSRDYITAIEQCVASAKSLNFGDSPVMNLFSSSLYGIDDSGYNNKCIELPSGEVVDPKGAIAWLEEQEGAGNE